MTRPLLLAHYMPWYESRPFSGQWGWHWTMNHFNPDAGDLASRFHPLIGPYDSSDPAVLEYQCLLMKMSGIDGVLIDWYGIDNLDDYARNNRNTELMMEAASRAGLKFGVVYEDWTLDNLVKKGRVKSQDAAAHGTQTLEWLENHFYNRSGYLRLGGRPVLLVFDPDFFKKPEWAAAYAAVKHKPALFLELGREGAAIGAFGWPEPTVPGRPYGHQLDIFYGKAKAYPSSIAVAFPRFQDIYAQAGVHPSWGSIEDQGGKTYAETLARALKSGAQMVQIATWNDWGEGTQIEPSKEFGYRDLEVTQGFEKSIKRGLRYSAADLRLPVKLYEQRKKLRGSRSAQIKLDRVSAMLSEGRTRALPWP